MSEELSEYDLDQFEDVEISYECKTCKEARPISMFYKRKASEIMAECKSCWNKRSAKNYQSDRDSRLVKMKAYAKRKKEELKK
jgi:hypothetical protein